MQQHLTLRPLARALALSCTFALPAAAHAEVISFSVANSITDNISTVESVETGTASGTSLITQFNANLGVLMGTTLQVTSTATQTVTASINGHDKRKGSATVSGTGSGWNLGFAAPGANTSFAGMSLAPVTASCTTSVLGCAARVTDAGTAVNSGLLSVTGAALNSYVGGGTVLGSYSANTQVNAVRESGSTGTFSATYGLNWGGNLSVAYDYLLHAAGSFANSGAQNVLDLDFGTVSEGSSQELTFDIFNLYGERVGLDLDGILGIGDAGKFGLNCAFSALGAGSSEQCFASFDTSSIGDFLASYTFNLSDADVGAASSRRDHTLQLNIRGRVANATSAVPEPGSLALLGGGLLALWRVGRKKGRSALPN